MAAILKCFCYDPDGEEEGYSNEKTPLVHLKDTDSPPGFAATPQTSTPYTPLLNGGSMSLSNAYHSVQGETAAKNIVKALAGLGRTFELQTTKLTIQREVVAYGGWDEWLAENVLNKLIDVVGEGDSGSWGDTFQKAVVEARRVASEVIEWVEDHPYLATAVVFVTVFGVLWLTCPWILEVLGFGEIGIVEGKLTLRRFCCSCGYDG